MEDQLLRFHTLFHCELMRSNESSVSSPRETQTLEYFKITLFIYTAVNSNVTLRTDVTSFSPGMNMTLHNYHHLRQQNIAAVKTGKPWHLLGQRRKNDQMTCFAVVEDPSDPPVPHHLLNGFARRRVMTASFLFRPLASSRWRIHSVCLSPSAPPRDFVPV